MNDEAVIRTCKLWHVKRGERYRLCGEVFTFEKMDGMYARQYDERGELQIFLTDEDVEVIE